MMQGCTPLLNDKPHARKPALLILVPWGKALYGTSARGPVQSQPITGAENYVIISGTNGRDEVDGRNLTLLSSWGVCQASGLRVPLRMHLRTLLPATIKLRAKLIHTSPLPWFNYHKTSLPPLSFTALET